MNGHKWNPDYQEYRAEPLETTGVRYVPILTFKERLWLFLRGFWFKGW